MQMRVLWAAVFAPLALGLAGCATPVSLHPPTCAKLAARRHETVVDLAPISVATAAKIQLGDGTWSGAPPDAAVTSGMRTELEGRALRNGEAGGYSVKCALDRFSVRRDAGVAETRMFATMYIDLSCDVVRNADRSTIFRGELRARAAASRTNLFQSDTTTLQRLVDRMLSDATRELASDLAVRALALANDPSQRVFADDLTQQELSATDDSAIGALALQENPTALVQLVPTIESAVSGAHADGERASLWNAIAMSAGPEPMRLSDEWLASDKLHLDDDELIRFYQYKALARRASPSTLEQLRAAATHESDALLLELVKDSLATGGIGMARRQRP